MSNLKLLTIATTILIGFSQSAHCETIDDLKARFDKLLPFKVETASKAPIAGFYQFETSKGIFYASEDGKYIFSGSLHKFEEGLMNLTALRLNDIAQTKLGSVEKDLIVYKAKHEKYRVTVFTDPTCPYCQKLHENMKGYNDLGITVAYAAYPRGGVNSPMDGILKSIWCAKDQKAAFDSAMARVELPAGSCKNPVDDMYAIGDALGVNGTPALLLSNGELMPGFMPPELLLRRLKEKLQ